MLTNSQSGNEPQTILDDPLFAFEQRQIKSSYAEVLQQSKHIFVSKMQKRPPTNDELELETYDPNSIEYELGCDALQIEKDFLPILKGMRVAQQTVQLPNGYTNQQAEHIKSILIDLFPTPNQIRADSVLFALGFIAKLNEDCRDKQYKDLLEKTQNILLLTYGFSIFERNTSAKANHFIFLGISVCVITTFMVMGVLLFLNGDDAKTISPWYALAGIGVSAIASLLGALFGGYLRKSYIESTRAKHDVESHINQAKPFLMNYWQSPVIASADTDGNNNNNQLVPVVQDFWNLTPTGDFLIDNIHELLRRNAGLMYDLDLVPQITIIPTTALTPPTVPQATL